MTERTSLDVTVPPLVGILPPQCQKDVDTLRQFIHKTVSGEAPSAPVSPNDFREVFLTGTTGFIGRFFLRDLLLQDADLVVHCLVRADSAEHGHTRIRVALEHAEIWDESFASRIRVVIGDIGQARFGLSDADFNGLCHRIDAVYHLAADINLASSYLDIRKINTFSIRNVLELCLRTRFKHLFYASTMGVFPQYFFTFAHEFKHSRIDHHMQPDLASMKKMFPIGLLGYPWSKLTSEQILLFAQQAGMPLAIFRLPQTSLSSTGYTPAHDPTVRTFAAVLDSKTMPEEFSFRASNEAVDTLSEACTAISLNPERRFTIYHCCNPQLDHYDFEPADFGFYWPEVPYESFKRACQERGENSPLHGYWAVFDHFGKYWFSNNKPKDRLPICDRAIREDCPHSIEWPGTWVKLKRSKEWIMAHREEWPYPIAQSRLDFDYLLVRARRYAEDLGVPFDSAYPEWMRQGLQQLVRAMNAPDAKLLKDRLSDIVFELNRFLRNNTELANERRQHPEIEREEITRPVFIVGINRTGTTYLHRLMSRDKRFWSLRLYELAEPVLWTGEYATVAGTPDDPRRLRMQGILEASDILKVVEGVHHFDVDEPEEDFPIFRMTFSAWVSIARFHIPEYGRWLAASGSWNAYAFHRRILQHFAWQRRQREPEHQGQWLLKMPFHLMELETLVKTYPDALFIQTHREPSQFMGSWNSLVERVRSLTSEPLPPNEFGAEQQAFISGMLDKAVDFRSAHPELEHRWMDVNYVDLIEDPFGVVRSIYQHFGWTLEQAAVDAMEEWQIRQAEKRRAEKRHRYALEDYGLTPEAVNAAFARYRDFLTTRGLRASRA